MVRSPACTSCARCLAGCTLASPSRIDPSPTSSASATHAAAAAFDALCRPMSGTCAAAPTAEVTPDRCSRSVRPVGPETTSLYATVGDDAGDAALGPNVILRGSDATC